MAIKSLRAYSTTGLALLGSFTVSVGDVANAQANGPECQSIARTDYPGPKVKVATHSDFAKMHYGERILQFSAEPLACGEIIMLGDSLTEKHDWSQDVKSDWPVRNRGIAGDTTDGLLLRLDEIIRAQPRAVFVLIGTNDLWSANSPSKTVQNISRIVNMIKANSPKTKLFVQTVFPIRSEPSLNSNVEKINRLLQAQHVDQNYDIIDTHALMADHEGLLRAEITTDGVHLNAIGYEAWVGLINEAIEKAREPVPGG